jgi:uridine phosphorylase
MAFPNFKGKHAHDAMFTPRDCFRYMRRIGKNPIIKADAAIFCYSSNLMKYIGEHKQHKTFEYHHHKGYLVKEKGKTILVYGGFGIGSPGAGAYLEEFTAMGIRRFMSIGTAGGLQKDLNIGDIVVCDKAVRDEGTSHHYLPPSKYAYASPAMTEALVSALKKNGISPRIGASWTIDAPFRETVKEARQYQKEGVLTVEMEASALFAIAAVRKVEMGALFTISDSLASLKWQPKLYHKKTTTGLETLYHVAVDALTHK